MKFLLIKLFILLISSKVPRAYEFRCLPPLFQLELGKSPCYLRYHTIDNVTYVQDYSKYSLLDFFDCTMDSLPPNLFKHFQNVETLKVDSKLRNLKKDDFMDNKKLKEIYLIKIELEILTNETFYYCKSLKILEITDSKIKIIENDAFVGAEKLKVLLIFGSAISSVNKKIFAPLRSLHEIQIMKSNVEHLEENLFYENKVLKWVNFNGNKLVSISETTFIGKQLNFLSFDYNQLVEIARYPAEWLRVIYNNLTEIWIMQDYLVVIGSNNQIENIKCDEFSLLRNLYLSYNQLTSLQCISDLERLTILDLSNNLLRHFTPDSFRKLIYLKFLELKDNQLFNFDVELLEPLRSLKMLRIDGLLSYSNLTRVLPNITLISVAEGLDSNIKSSLSERGVFVESS